MPKYGRIKRNKAQIAKATKAAKRGPSVRTWIGRGGNNRYSAYACLGMGSVRSKPSGHERCSKLVQGRTPQAAIAKALKQLSGVVARRGKLTRIPEYPNRPMRFKYPTRTTIDD